MGDVIPLPNRLAPQASPDLVELATWQIVGQVRVIAACDPGCEDSGPYKVALRAEGVPEQCLITLTNNPEQPDGLMRALKNFSTVALTTLQFAADHATLLAPPDPPRGAA